MESATDDDYQSSDGEMAVGGCDIQREPGVMGGAAGGRIIGWNGKTVHCEEVEDEDSGENWETEDDAGGEDEEEETDDEEQQAQGSEQRTLWTCDVCSITVNIFARDDHLRSRRHLQATRPGIHPSSPPPPPPSWHCTLCVEDMSVFQQPSHLASKPHLTALLQHTRTHALTPDPTSSSSFQFRTTFYCLTCAAEFDRAEQELHLATSDIWVCEQCGTRMHPAARERHLDCESHAAMKAPERHSEIGIVGERAALVAQRGDNVVGLVQRIMEARAKREVSSVAESARTVTAETTWYCDMCGRDVEWRRMASHVVAHCRTEARPAKGPQGGEQVPQLKKAKKSKKAKKKAKKAKEAKKAAEAKKATEAKKQEAGTIYCNVCRNYQNTAGITAHLNSGAHRKNTANYYPTQAAPAPTREGKVYCVPCGKYKCANGMAQHVQSASHRSKVWK